MVIKEHQIIQEFEEVREQYPGLHLLKKECGEWLIRGPLLFQADYASFLIKDEYYIEIAIPTNYPIKVPLAREVGGRIPRAFHTNLDGDLCLGAPLKNNRSFSKKKTLRGFIENCLVPFLYAFSYKERKGELPFGELPHGYKGIVQCYKAEFQTNDVKLIIEFLKILAQHDFPGFNQCPCRSGKRLWRCHGDKLLELKNLQLPEEYASELHMILTMS